MENMDKQITMNEEMTQQDIEAMVLERIALEKEFWTIVRERGEWRTQ
jgi:hypothetical protein